MGHLAQNLSNTDISDIINACLDFAHQDPLDFVKELKTHSWQVGMWVIALYEMIRFNK